MCGSVQAGEGQTTWRASQTGRIGCVDCEGIDNATTLVPVCFMNEEGRIAVEGSTSEVKMTTNTASTANQVFMLRAQCLLIQISDLSGLWSPHLYTSHKKHQNGCIMTL
jgi:hypothetical protein